ncbi:phytanoyl-CoA dioxygenase family protein [Rhabdothermincola salaria]|uniref:phytanoyl-CoA dioxygenase family protein n=1 Tax=Rhabdothermincola salaria TaxID=2903142 RepID=UPI001E2CEEF1|nr:phytanoyl-CoA dioxygenase family protein [Rhabdothermincola salaria]
MTDETTSDTTRPSTAEAVEQITRDGYTILERVVPDDLVAELVERVDVAMARQGTAYGTNTFLGHHTRRLFNLLARDPAFARVPVFEPVLDVASGVLDEGLLVSSMTAIEMNPGQAPQPFHADDGSIPLPRPHVPITCVAIWALTDFTEENGATRLVPGSHRADRIPRKGEQPDELVEATMPAGSVLVYNGSVWHGGGENRSDARRMGLVSNYCAGWVRHEENQLLALSPEQVAAFPPRLRRMVGYGIYRGLIGHVDQVDPATWLDPDTASDLVWDRIR